MRGRAAIHFSTGFYDGLGAELDIESAFDFGVNAIELNRSPTDANSRTFGLDEDGADTLGNQPEITIPVLLKSDIQRSLSVADGDDIPTTDDSKKEKKWSLSAFLKLPLFKIGFSVTLTLLVISSVMPLLINYQGGQSNTSTSIDDFKLGGAEEPTAAVVAAAPAIIREQQPPRVALPKPRPSAVLKTRRHNQTHKLEVIPQGLVLFLGTLPKKLYAKVLTLNNQLVPNQPISWRSADTNIASVHFINNNSRAVLVVGHKKGKTKIYVEANDLLDIISVVVK